MKDLCKDEWKIIPSELSNVAPQLKKEEDIMIGCE
jgi:hypothetical protein